MPFRAVAWALFPGLRLVLWGAVEPHADRPRYYMAAVGRWSSVDPVADSFPSWTPYNYVEGNPVSYSDPFGLCPWCIGAAAGALAGAATEVGAQALTGEWNGPSIALAGLVGAAAGGIATAATVGKVVKFGAMVAMGAGEAGSKSQAETSADLGQDMAAGAVVGAVGAWGAEVVQSARAASPVAGWLRSKLATRTNSISSRMDMRALLRRIEENAVAAGMFVGSILNRAGGEKR